jgi:phytoene/squalene synthetase
MSLSDHAFYPDFLIENQNRLLHQRNVSIREQVGESDQSLPLSITAAASKQTYYTIRLLVDRDRVLDAYRAYAYFRWVDDCLDQNLSTDDERTSFLVRQQAILESCFNGEFKSNLTAEERMLADLIQNNPDENNGLRAYLENMMAVMAFDADRRARLISQDELDAYSHYLAVGVTEAMHYFIGHDDPSPQCEARYAAVTAAHITHMLRDTCEDIDAGYFNIPREFLALYEIDANDIVSDAYKEWVKSRVQLAREHFAVGKGYLGQVRNLRCRVAGYAYMARFVGMLNTIERDGYCLRSEYKKRKSLKTGLWMILFVASATLQSLFRGR